MEGDEVVKAEKKEASSSSTTVVQESKTKKLTILMAGLMVTVFFAVGIYVILISGRGENQCQMTYMYEYPQYVPIDLKSAPVSPPHYKLYAYGEGKATERLRKGKFVGIPVLFIPGNSGSHKQVRSLASVALRKSLDDQEHRPKFDFFAVDFEEELSAVYGGVLERQSR